MSSQWASVQERIIGYYNCYYEMLGSKHYNTYRLQDFFAPTFKGSGTYREEADYLEAQIRHQAIQINRLVFQKPAIQVEWHSIYLANKKCIVHLNLQIALRYNGLDVVTKLASTEQELKLVQRNNDWYIEEINDTKEAMEQTREKDKQRKRRIVMRTEEEPKGVYDRQKAVEYAKKYAVMPNTKDWGNYASYGGDCTNFVSQCLYAGDIPFDHVGKDVTQKWYWYSDNYRTPSWTSANALKIYMMKNTGYGLIARLADLQEMVPGDVVQLGTLDKTTHSMLVVDVVYKDENKQEIIDLLVAQHSIKGGISGYNIPLSTKAAPKLYFKIVGYNPIYT